MNINIQILERMTRHLKERGDRLSIEVLKFALMRIVCNIKLEDKDRHAEFVLQRKAFLQKCHNLGEVILYDAGQEGLVYLSELTRRGICVVAIMGTFKTGLFVGERIIALEEYKEKYSGASILITPTGHAKWEIKQFLENNGVSDLLYFDKNGSISGTWSTVREAMELYEKCGDDLYFSIPEMPWGEDEVFVDCGIFCGETALEFRSQCEGRGHYNYKAFCFEPDPINFSIASGTLGCIRGVKLINAGVGEHEGVGKFVINASGSHFGEDGTENIKITTLDRALKGESVTFIKMDIEGGELAALKGAAEIIRTQKPKLAICVYHKYEDIWEIPEYIWSLNPEYKLFLRHHGNSIHETVMYAIA